MLDEAHEAQFGTLVRLVARQFRCPIAWLAVLADDSPLRLIAHTGLPDATLPAEASDTMKVLADAQHAMPSPHMLACRVSVQTQHAGVLCVAHHPSRPDDPPFTDQDGATLDEFSLLAGALLTGRLKEAQWREQAERVREASLSSSDWLWESDETGQVRWVSSAVETHTGQPPDAIVGRTLAQINTPLEDDTSFERYRQARARLAPFRDVLARRPSPDGFIIVSISGMPVFDTDGRFRGYRGTTSNVTVSPAAAIKFNVSAPSAAIAAHIRSEKITAPIGI